MNIQGKNILLISPDSWGDYYLSKHHYAMELSKANNVFFLNAANANPDKKETIRKITVGDKQVLNLVDYQNTAKGIAYYPVFLQAQLYRQLAKKISGMLPKLDIVWSFDLHRFPNLKVFNAPLSIFHPVDLYESKIVHKIADSADILFATSESIIQKLGVKNKPAYTINHGLANDFLEAATADKQEELSGENKVKAALIGNPLHKHLSQEQLFTVIDEHPTVDFYFIGSVRENKEISPENIQIYHEIAKKPNTFYLGKKEFWELKNYMALMDVLLICYDREKHEDAPPNPHKLLEYLSSGKTIVSNYFESYKNEKELINMSETIAAYPTVFKETIRNLVQYNRPELAEKRKQFAQDHTYQKQLERITEKLEKHQLLF